MPDASLNSILAASVDIGSALILPGFFFSEIFILFVADDDGFTDVFNVGFSVDEGFCFNRFDVVAVAAPVVEPTEADENAGDDKGAVVRSKIGLSVTVVFSIFSYSTESGVIPTTCVRSGTI